MKTKFYSALIAVLCLSNYLHAQNTFPSTGRAGVYTTAPAASLQVKGGARLGTLTNYVNIDSATGNLSFAGTSGYLVGGNKYAFQYSGNPNYGLFFNSTAIQYEFRNSSAVPVFSVNANSGNVVANGTLKVGAYTLPATDGSSNQVLTTNGAGAVRWSTVSSGGSSQWTTSGSNIYYSTGNVGIGTTTPAALLDVNGDAHINSVTVGLGSGNVSTNAAFGYQALYSNTTAYSNTATGWYALHANTTGSYNSANGFAALHNNTTGEYNTAFGNLALYDNTTGTYNTATGSSALALNTTGGDNTAAGYQALYSNTTGGVNTANGVSALYSNTTGNYNTASGYYALYTNTGGNFNTAAGYEALNDNTTGTWNTASGDVSLYTNSTGLGNVATGSGALYSNTTGNYNTASGMNALENNTTGSYNTAIGNNAGVPTGSTVTNATAIGYNATVAQSNSLVLGGTGSYAVKVGIGTTTPGANLDMIGGSWDLSSNEGDFRIGNPTYRMKIGVATDGGGAGDVRMRAAGGTARLILGSNTTDVLTINSAGKVGIGTTNPQYPLSVNGTIQAKEVRVETGWSDFVFDKNYKLRTLSEVEKYIDQNHHLPQIPSAADIQKNGLAVADVQTKMMQKIEELTLYIIQMQKQIDQLKSNNHENK